MNNTRNAGQSRELVGSSLRLGARQQCEQRRFTHRGETCSTAAPHIMTNAYWPSFMHRYKQNYSRRALASLPISATRPSPYFCTSKPSPAPPCRVNTRCRHKYTCILHGMKKALHMPVRDLPWLMVPAAQCAALPGEPSTDPSDTPWPAATEDARLVTIQCII